MNKIEQSTVSKLKQELSDFKEEFHAFRDNEFKHLSWKVKFLVIATLAVLGMGIAILCQAVF